MASIETDSPSSPEEPVERFRAGVARLKGRGDLIPDCGPRHSAKPLKRRKQ